jgi:hypothetical protein
MFGTWQGSPIYQQAVFRALFLTYMMYAWPDCNFVSSVLKNAPNGVSGEARGNGWVKVLARSRAFLALNFHNPENVGNSLVA